MKHLAVPGVGRTRSRQGFRHAGGLTCLMGWSAARKLRRSVDGLTRVVAVEVLTAARALDLRLLVERRPPPRRGRAARGVRHQRPVHERADDRDGQADHRAQLVALFDLLDEEEMGFVIAHELGHALSGHAVYRTLLTAAHGPDRMLLNDLDPRGSTELRVMIAALYEWIAQGGANCPPTALVLTRHPRGRRDHAFVQSGKPVGDLMRARPDLLFAQGADRHLQPGRRPGPTGTES